MRAKGNDTSLQPQLQAVTVAIRDGPHYGIWTALPSKRAPLEAQLRLLRIEQSQSERSSLKPEIKKAIRGRAGQ